MAVNRVIGRLGVQLSADTKQLQKSFSTASQRVQQSVSKMKTSFGVLSKAAGVLTGLGAGISLAGFKKVTDELDRIGKTADRIGITTDSLQQFEFAARRSGISTEALRGSLERFTRRLGEAQTGNKAYKQTFSELGVAITDTNGNLLKADEVLENVVDSLAKTEDLTVKTALASQAFGREGGAGIVALSKEYKNLAAEIKGLGGIVDENLIRNSEKINDRFETLSTVIKTQLQSAFVELGPVILAVGKKIAQIAEVTIQFLRDIGVLDEKIETTTDKFIALKEELGQLQITQTRAKNAIDLYAKQLREGIIDQKTYNLGIGALSQAYLDAKKKVDEATMALDNFTNAEKNAADAEAKAKQAVVDLAKARLEAEKKREEAAIKRKEQEKEAQAALKALKDEGQTLKDSLATPFEEVNAKLKRYKELLEEGVISTETFYRASKNAIGEYNKTLETKVEKTKDAAKTEESALANLRERWTDYSNNIELAVVSSMERSSSALADFVTEGKINFKDLAKSIINDLTRIAIQSALIKAITGAFPGFGGETTTPKGKQTGGPVAQGKAFLVGEMGPELFVPSSPGRIIPAGQTQSKLAQGSQQPITVNLTNNGTDQQVQDVQYVQSMKGPILNVILDDLNTNGKVARNLNGRFARRTN